jgi:hypothetical protein
VVIASRRHRERGSIQTSSSEQGERVEVAGGEEREEGRRQEGM